MRNQHKTLWTFQYQAGGYVRFDCLEDCRAYALASTAVGRMIPPVYGPDYL